jgi:hypothetical protein
MKVTATRDVYTYDELPPDAQKRALELLRNEAWESLDSDMVTEDLSAEYVIETYSECHELTRRFTDEGEFAPTPFWTDDNGEGGN